MNMPTQFVRIPEGALTALVTPFNEDYTIDYKGLTQLIGFQASQGISGIVTVGTTGESPTLCEYEYLNLLFTVLHKNYGLFILSGCGSNSTAKALAYVKHVVQCGGKGVLMVDPYYNGPSSSLEIREEYYAPIASRFPNTAFVPYIIPGRTGCQLLPEDLALLALRYPNVCAVKEATGKPDIMQAIRSLAPPNFQIFSGDDGMTLRMMADSKILACGVISVISNIAPAAVQEMCQALLRGEVPVANGIRAKLQPLFDIVTVSAKRTMGDRNVGDRFRNPVPIKTAMNILGMPAGPCRQPLGKMSRAGFFMVRDALFSVHRCNPEIFLSIGEFFDVDVADRLGNSCHWDNLHY